MIPNLKRGYIIYLIMIESYWKIHFLSFAL